MAAEESRSKMLKTITSIRRTIVSKLQQSLPLLPVTDADAHPITQNLQKLELGKLAFTLANMATLTLILSHKFPAADIDNVVVVCFMAAQAAVWHGFFFGKMYQLLGTNLVLVCYYVLVGSFLPLRYSWACWLFAALSLIPFLSLLVTPSPLPIPA